MVGVTTVALLDRKIGMSRELFTRYWRDVHGVMAARIPGFDSYTQYHVTPVADAGSHGPMPTFEGIAIVTFRSESDRGGLMNSEVTKHIHRDERNVFRGALLYSLPAGASMVRQEEDLAPGTRGAGYFFLSPQGLADLEGGLQAVQRTGLRGLETHDLSGGDPAAWNDTDVDALVAGQRFAALVRAEWAEEKQARRAVEEAIRTSAGRLFAFRVDESHVMVDGGRPTPVGLRGLDAVRTIEQAGATNQLERAVEEAVYGRLGLDSRAPV